MTAHNPSVPSGAKAPSGRRAAVQALLAIEQAKLLSDELFDRLSADARLDTRERALMVELTRGVLRRRGTLDWRLTQQADRKIAKLPTLVQTVLRLGAYQLLYLDRIPDSAAVNESVQLMKSYRGRLGRDWSGYVNAVLRALGRAPVPDWPDAAVAPVQAFTVRYSCPAWLVDRWITQWGPAQAEQLCRASAETPPLTLRTNTLRTSRSALLERFAAAHREAGPTLVSPVGIQVASAGPVSEMPGFAEGWFYVEDEAAQLIPPLLDVRPGQRVLDACAAPGGKATHVAALMDNRGTLVAMDRDAARLERVMDNSRRLGVTMLTPVVGDLRVMVESARAWPPALREPFDRILLDAPCSGLGVLRRHPEGKWYKTPESIAQQPVVQRELLAATARLLRPGGLLIYSTCSVEPDETTVLIDEVCEARGEFERESVAPWLPLAALPFMTPRGDLSTMINTNRMDAFYAARLRKRAS